MEIHLQVGVAVVSVQGDSLSVGLLAPLSSQEHGFLHEKRTSTNEVKVLDDWFAAIIL